MNKLEQAETLLKYNGFCHNIFCSDCCFVKTCSKKLAQGEQMILNELVKEAKSYIRKQKMKNIHNIFTK
jgi:hypothetical protein